MRLKQTSLLVVISCLVFVLLVSTSTKAGADAVKVVVKDPQSGVEFETTDPALMGFFAFANLSARLPVAPTPSVPGYLVTRYWDNGPFDRFHYYPSSEDTPAYIYYDGFIQGWSDSDGAWYAVPEETDAAMKKMLIEHKLPVKAENPLVSYLLAAVAAIGVLGFAGFVYFKRKSR